MSVTFVIGRSGAGKSAWCLDRIVESLRRDPLGPPIFWLLPRQATFTAERRLTCDQRLHGFCRARVLSFEQLGEQITAECGGSAVPEVTPLGRQMILGHLLRQHAGQLRFFRGVERQAGLAAELDRTLDEFERSGKTTEDLSLLLDELSPAAQADGEAAALAAKLHDLLILFDAYAQFLGQERLDQHRRLRQVLESVERCSLIRNATLYIDGFYEFTSHEREMLGAIARAGATLFITALIDPAGPLPSEPHALLDEMRLLHRTERTYLKLHSLFQSQQVRLGQPIVLGPTPHREQLAFNLFPSAAPAPSVKKAAPPRPGRKGEQMGLFGEPPPKRAASPTLFDAAPPPNAAPPQNAAPRADRREGETVSDWRVVRVAAPTRADETQAVARRIMSLLGEGFRLRDIAVLARRIDLYHPLLARTFEEQGLAYFVDRRRTGAHHPLLQLLRATLAVARSDWNHDALFSLLKTGLAGAGLEEVDALENYVLLHRVRGRQWESDEKWAWRSGHAPGDEIGPADDENAERAEALRCRLRDAIWPLAALLRPGSPLPVRDIATELFAVFERLGVRQALQTWMGELSDEADEAERAASPHSAGLVSRRLEQRDEHEQIWRKLVELFEQVVDLLGEQRVTPADFVDIVESGLDRFDLAITPPTADQVLVGQLDRTRLPPVRAVFVLGLCEGDFPLPPAGGSVLTDRDRREMHRRKLELDPGSHRQLLDERLLAYLAFAAPSDRLILTRPMSDDAGRPLAASVFWELVGRHFPNVQTQTLARAHGGSIDEISTPRQLIAALLHWGASGAPDDQPASADLEGLYQWLADRAPRSGEIGHLLRTAWPSLSYQNAASLSPAAAAALFPAPLSATARQLETMAACPFKHFARHGLRLRAREDPSVGSLDLGQLYHRLLELLMARALRSGGDEAITFSSITPAMIHDAAQQVARSLRGELMLSTARNRYLLQRVEQTLAEWLASQRAMFERCNFRPLRGATAFAPDATLPPVSIVTATGPRIDVRGRMDRIDALADSGQAIIYDYKLKAGKLSLGEVYHGLALELVTCLLALQAGGAELSGDALSPVAAFYLQVMRGINDVDHPDQAPEPGSEDYLLSAKSRGLFVADAFANLDHKCSAGWSPLVAAYVNKAGEFGQRAKSDVLFADEFNALLGHVRECIADIAGQILSGDISVRPYYLSGKTPCPGCDFRSVCRFEKAVDPYRPLQAVSGEQALVKIRLKEKS